MENGWLGLLTLATGEELAAVGLPVEAETPGAGLVF